MNEYAILNLEWKEEQEKLCIAIVHGVNNETLEKLLEDLNKQRLIETDEDEGLYADDAIEALRNSGLKVDVPDKINQYDNWNGSFIRGNKENDN